MFYTSTQEPPTNTTLWCFLLCIHNSNFYTNHHYSKRQQMHPSHGTSFQPSSKRAHRSRKQIIRNLSQGTFTRRLHPTSSPLRRNTKSQTSSQRAAINQRRQKIPTQDSKNILPKETKTSHQRHRKKQATFQCIQKPSSRSQAFTQDSIIRRRPQHTSQQPYTS